MNCAAPLTQSPPLTRADGHVRLSSKLHAGNPVLDGLYQRGALKAVFPRGRDLTAVMVNTSGGVTGGDQFRLEARVGAESALTLTTQAAERAYKARPGEVGHVRTRLSVEAAGRLSWLPQETIVFDGADFDRTLTCDLAAGSEALLVEPLILGRAAMGERDVAGRLSERIDIRQTGRLIYRDSWTLQGDLTAQFARAGVGGGATAMASVIYVGPRAEAVVDRLRSGFERAGGASLRASDLAVGRILAPDGYTLRKRLVPVLETLTRGGLPVCWRL